MYQPFEEISGQSRIWVFSSVQDLDQNQEEFIRQTLEKFTSAWESHQKPVLASFKILEKRFVIIAANEQYSEISGCGIDKGMHVIQDIENSLQISLTDKSLLHFRNGNTYRSISLSAIKEKIASGEVSPEDVYCNTLVAVKDDLKDKFFIPASSSWLRKYFGVIAG